MPLRRLAEALPCLDDHGFMSATAKNLLKRFIPSQVRRTLRALVSRPVFRGNYPDWAPARAASLGYDDAAIVQKVLAATLEVRAGRAAFERDSVLFQTLEPDRPLLAALEEIVRVSGGHLRVLDFGGSLGTNYWRHRTFLPRGENLRWDVIEQAGFVEAGRQHLVDTPLRFYREVREACGGGGYDVLICSCVLQYLERPLEVLAGWRDLGIPYLLLNNLPLLTKGPDRVRVQHVPPEIYAASYPVWFFNRDAFLTRLKTDYEIVKEFDAEAVWPVGSGMLQSTGLLLKRRSSS
ncbi:MAG: hypothetical protein RIQ79_769 [Verrucomicrobiota bacterium]